MAEIVLIILSPVIGAAIPKAISLATSLVGVQISQAVGNSVSTVRRNSVSIKVLKTGPDRPVEPVGPVPGHENGSVHIRKSFEVKTGQKPIKPVKTS
ncbi:hypothetical protein SLEP1_g24680 [Rubroshorea leprosula]|uniref:Uncharacterized protein n=1 Tax=Rubroshorea leprosula TaxID=152421 RepID=A0AAV5JQN5_9ROSI|nr:hypothetical protein SLEP1_g24680 [Rubroshorea leprosula]